MTDELRVVAERVRAAVREGCRDDVATALHGLGEDACRALRKELLAELKADAALCQQASRQEDDEARGALAAEAGEPRLADWDYVDRRRSACRMAVVGLGLERDVRPLLIARSAWDNGDPFVYPLDKRFNVVAARLLLARHEAAWRGNMLVRLLRAAAHDVDVWLVEYRFVLAREYLARGVGDEEAVVAALGDLARGHGMNPAVWTAEPETAADPDAVWSDPLWRKVVWAGVVSTAQPSLPRCDYQDQLLDRLAEAEEAGHLERDPLLSAALLGAVAAANPRDCGWWVRLVERLAPADDEWALHSDLLLDLLAATNPPAAALGLKVARRLVASGALAAAEVAPVAACAVGAPTVGVATAALGLLRALVERDAELRGEALQAVLGALTHGQDKVRAAALDWLARDRWWCDDPELVARVSAEAELLAPAEAAALARALGADEGGAEEPAAAGWALPDLAEVRDELARLILRVPERRPWAQACLAPLAGRGALPDHPVPPDERWRLDAPFVVPTPEQTAHLLLTPEALYEHRPTLEQVLAGVRQPLSPAQRDEVRAIVKPVWRHGGAAALVRAWVGTAEERREPLPVRGQRKGVSLLRLTIAAARLRVDDHRSELGMPTHRGGWISPAVLVERLGQRTRWTGDDRLELAVALWRVPPEAGARHAVWPALRPLLRRLPYDERTVLAAVCDPSADARRLLGGLAGFRFRPLDPARRWLYLGAAFACWGADAVAFAADHPRLAFTPALLKTSWHWWLPEMFSGGANQALDCPAVARQVLTLDAADVDYRREVQRAVLAELAAAHFPLDRLLRELLSLAASNRPAMRAQALAVLAAGLRDGRLRSPEVIATAAELAGGGQLKPRWVLGGLAELGPVGRALAACAAEEALAGHLAAGTPCNSLLEGLREWREADGRGVEHPGARAWIEHLAQGDGRTASLARRVLALPPTPDGQPASRRLALAHDIAIMLAALDRVGTPCGNAGP